MVFKDIPESLGMSVNITMISDIRTIFWLLMIWDLLWTPLAPDFWHHPFGRYIILECFPSTIYAIIRLLIRCTQKQNLWESHSIDSGTLFQATIQGWMYLIDKPIPFCHEKYSPTAFNDFFDYQSILWQQKWRNGPSKQPVFWASIHQYGFIGRNHRKEGFGIQWVHWAKIRQSICQKKGVSWQYQCCQRQLSFGSIRWFGVLWIWVWSKKLLDSKLFRLPQGTYFNFK